MRFLTPVREWSDPRNGFDLKSQACAGGFLEAQLAATWYRVGDKQLEHRHSDWRYFV